MVVLHFVKANTDIMVTVSVFAFTALLVSELLRLLRSRAAVEDTKPEGVREPPWLTCLPAAAATAASVA